MKKYLKINIFCILLVFIFQNAIAQQYSILDSLHNVIQKEIIYDNERWKTYTLYDSIIVIEKKTIIKLRFKDLRRAHDSLKYKLFIVVRKNINDKTNTHGKRFLETYRDIQDKVLSRHRHTSLSKYSLAREWKPYLPIVIPPFTIHKDYQLVMFDNIRLVGLVPYTGSYEIEALLWKITNHLSDGGQYYSYLSGLLFIERKYPILDSFGFIHWAGLKKINYPHLFEK